MPFASTLDPTIREDQINKSTVWGNAYLNFKVLWLQSDCLNCSAGLAIDLPTARDTRFFVEGSEVVRLKNNTETLSPYISYLVTPNPDWFFQNWVALNLFRQGNPLLLSDGEGGLESIGRLREQNMLEVDAQLGYWLVSPCRGCFGWLRGLGLFGELHYNAALGHAPQVALPGAPVVFGFQSSGYNEVNLAPGLIFLLGDRVNLTVGAALPATSGRNRSFDYQIGVRCNILFGAAYLARTQAGMVSTF
jgi:hypothetical protein